MRLAFLLASLFFYTSIPAQNADIVGYWQVITVHVGEENMTPVAKWFHLDPSGALQGGNGGNINLFGSWETENTDQLLFSDNNQQADPAGAFTIEQTGSQMTWTRTEEGQQVTINLQRFEPTDWPQAPWDKITGAWRLNSEESTDSELPFQSVFFRWDHLAIFNRRTELPVWRAMWRINAHRPELELAPYDANQSLSNWQIQFEDKQMMWSRTIDAKEERLVWEKEE